jgi:hypothetical protein
MVQARKRMARRSKAIAARPIVCPASDIVDLYQCGFSIKGTACLVAETASGRGD